MGLKMHLHKKTTQSIRHKKNKEREKHIPPPFLAAKYGKRQTFPRPTEFEIKENTNSRGRSHS